MSQRRKYLISATLRYFYSVKIVKMFLIGCLALNLITFEITIIIVLSLHTQTLPSSMSNKLMSMPAYLVQLTQKHLLIVWLKTDLEISGNWKIKPTNLNGLKIKSRSGSKTEKSVCHKWQCINQQVNVQAQDKMK